MTFFTARDESTIRQSPFIGGPSKTAKLQVGREDAPFRRLHHHYANG